jgi:hypothetical protein
LFAHEKSGEGYYKTREGVFFMNLQECASLPEFLGVLDQVTKQITLSNNGNPQVNVIPWYSSSGARAAINNLSYGSYINVVQKGKEFWVGVFFPETKEPANIYLWFPEKDKTALDALFKQNPTWNTGTIPKSHSNLAIGKRGFLYIVSMRLASIMGQRCPQTKCKH